MSARSQTTPDASEVRSYYGKGIINRPVWTWEIPCYFFTGGLAGASATLAGLAEATGRSGLARVARRVAAAGALASPPLLISDLGRPDRFHHMLRIVKPTSPMSVGSWLLAVFVPVQALATVLAELDRLSALRRIAQAASATLGPGMATYTAVLFSDTAVPVWHEARHELPAVFAGSAAASAGAAGVLFTADGDAGPARRLALLGAVTELGATQVMERRLGELAEPYHRGQTAAFAKAAKGLTAAGAMLTALGGRRRGAAVTGAAMLLAGSLAERWAVYQAGFASADDPAYTVKPQRQRAQQRTAHQ